MRGRNDSRLQTNAAVGIVSDERTVCVGRVLAAARAFLLTGGRVLLTACLRQTY